MKNRPYPLYPHKDLTSIREIIEYSAERYQKQPAFTYVQGSETIRVTYKQLNKDVQILGTAFLAHGLADKKIAVLGENSYFWILTYFAAVSIGSVIVPLDRDLPAQDMKGLLNDSGASVLVYSADYKEKAWVVYGNNQISCLTHVWEMENDLSSLMDLGRELIAGGNTDYHDVQLDVDKMCTLLYTSGTTGIAKGVMLSHRNIAGNVVAISRHAKFEGRTILVPPLHHSVVLTLGVCVNLNQGVNIFINNDIRHLAQDMQTFSPTFMMAVPAIVEMFYNKIWENIKKSGKEQLLKQLIRISNFSLRLRIDLRKLLFRPVIAAFGGNMDLIFSGSAPLDVRYCQGFLDFGIQVLEGYGLTECSPIVSISRNHYYRYGSIGSVLSGYEARIDTPNEDGIGEICVKGGCVMLGYYKNEEATKATIKDGWFHTGDLGKIDSDGFIYIKGRIKNLIILSNGKNVYPEELEFNLGRIPLVQESLVYQDGNAIVAEIFPAVAVVAEKQIDNVEAVLQAEVTALNKTLPLYKNIHHIVVRDCEFEKTTSRKIKRKSAIASEEYAAPTNQIEEDFSRILAQVLDVSKVGINDNFIDLGGDSLKAISYVIELENAGYKISVEMIYECPTVASLAEAYESIKKREDDKVVSVNFEETDVDNGGSIPDRVSYKKSLSEN